MVLVFLLFRFLSIPKGFSYLNERGYVSKQLDKWQKAIMINIRLNYHQILSRSEDFDLINASLQEYNLKYVDLIEEQLNEALTTYRKPVDGDNYVRRSNQR